jgi:hypothetical protein
MRVRLKHILRISAIILSFAAAAIAQSTSHAGGKLDFGNERLPFPPP